MTQGKHSGRARPADQAGHATHGAAEASPPYGDHPSRISVQWNHIDGPMMRLPNGQLRWLTLRERFMHWLGRWSLEDIARRPGDLKLVYYPPHDTWLNLPAADVETALWREVGLAIGEARHAIAMEARQRGDGEARLHPKDDSAGLQGIAQGGAA